jgi:hypothetical protein
MRAHSSSSPTVGAEVGGCGGALEKLPQKLDHLAVLPFEQITMTSLADGIMTKKRRGAQRGLLLFSVLLFCTS